MLHHRQRVRTSSKSVISFRTLALFSLAFFALALILLGFSLPDLQRSGRTERSHPQPPPPDDTLPPLPQPRPATIQRCPHLSGQDQAQIDAKRGEPCSFIVHNEAVVNTELLYVTSDGKEKRYFVADFNSSQQITSYTGDLWRVRSRHGELFKEFRTPVCSPDARGSAPSIVVPECASADAPTPLAPAASAATRGAFTAERLRACGSERVLSHAHLSPGMHLLCPIQADEARVAHGAIPAGVALAMALFADGRRNAPPAEPPAPTHVFLVPSPAPAGADGAASTPRGITGDLSGLTPERLIAYALAELERMRPPSPHQPAALFTLSGVLVDTADGIAAAITAGHALLLYEGGQWLWPAARIGQEHVVTFSAAIDGSAGGTAGGTMAAMTGPAAEEAESTAHLAASSAPSGSVRLRVLSVKPRIVEVDDFLTDAECDHILSLSLGHMHSSGVSMKEEDAKAGHTADEYRTSTQYSMHVLGLEEAVLTRHLRHC